MLGRWAAAAAVVVGAITASAPGGARAADEPCARFGSGVVSGHVESSKLTEISGVVASRRHPGVYWTHNDSGGRPEFYALTLDGTDLGAYPLTGATAVDWEDIAIGPKRGATGSYLYAGDIGDNAAELPGVMGTPRDHITVYRVAEPAAAPHAPGATLGGVEKFTLHYPAGANDAEAMLVDPVSGDLVIITKSPLGLSRVMVAPAASLIDGATITLVDAGGIQIIPPVKVSTFPGTWLTGADISPDGSLILLRTYQQVLAFTRAPGQSVPDALQGERCVAPSVDEQQGEAVAIAADMSRYVTVSEGINQPINVFSIGGAASVTTTTAPTTTGAATS